MKCSVLGCLNNSKVSRGKSFFSTPSSGSKEINKSASVANFVPNSKIKATFIVGRFLPSSRSDEKTMSDLVWAIKNGEIDQVREIIESKKVTSKDFDVNTEINGRFPLHYAADYGQNEVLGYLIQMGADVNAKDKHGITPMLAAIWEGHTECVRTLINKGAQKEGTTPDGTKNYMDSAEKIEIKELLK